MGITFIGNFTESRKTKINVEKSARLGFMVINNHLGFMQMCNKCFQVFIQELVVTGFLLILEFKLNKLQN